MQYAKLGHSNLTVSRVCMGCMGFGEAGSGQHSWTLDEEHAREINRHGLEGAAQATDLELTAQECAWPEEPYVPHALVGGMAQDTPAAVSGKPVWSTGTQKIEQV